MKKLLLLLGILFMSLFSKTALSQCSNFVSNFPSGTFSTSSATLTTVSTCVFGGEYAAYNVTSGNTYTWTTCGNSNFDTQLSLWNTAHSVSYAYNDDNCGLQSTITWTATFTGTVHVLLSQYYCSSNSTCMTIQWACTTCASGHNIGTGNLNACTGSLFDSGGSGGNYSNSESFTETYCSNSSNCIQVNFSAFSTESGYDQLSIYDGPTTGSPLIGLYQGTTSPGIVTSTTGCLTFVWTSDGSVVYPGWQAAISCPACVIPVGCAPSGLTTLYANNNGQDGVMFNITAINPVTITCFDGNFDPGTFNCNIYYKSGTHVGSETNSGAWSLIGSAINVGSNGNDIATPIPISISTGIAAGQTAAFYITTDGPGADMNYTNGTAVGNTLASDANISVKEGTGNVYPFSSVFSPREFNGTVYYSAGPLPVKLLSFTGTNQTTFNELNWETSSEINNDYFVLERSANGQDFEQIDIIQGSGNSNVLLKYSYQHNNPRELEYYRLKQVDFDGKFEYSNIIAVRNKTSLNVSIYPNPSKNNIFIGLSESAQGTYTIVYTNVLGSVSKEQIKINEGTNAYQVNEFVKLSPGIYFIQVLDENNEVIKTQKIVKE